MSTNDYILSSQNNLFKAEAAQYIALRILELKLKRALAVAAIKRQLFY